MTNKFLTTALENYFSANRSKLLSKADVLAETAKVLSTSGFSKYNKDKIDKLNEQEKILFAFKEGFLFTDRCFYFFDIGKGTNNIKQFEYKDFLTVEGTHKTLLNFGRLKINGVEIAKESNQKFSLEEYDILKSIIRKSDIEFQNEIQRQKQEAAELNEQNRISELNLVKSEREQLYKNLSTDNSATPTIIQITAFSEILEQNETKISEKDAKYILQFVRLSSFLKAKRESVISLYEQVDKVETMEDLKIMYPLLEEQNNILNQVLYYAINMVTSLVEGKMIFFYSIYEKFDKLGVFNSQWEKDLKNNLQDINSNLINVIRSINQMEQNLSNELYYLGQEIGDSINNMSANVSAQLQKTNSKLDYNNLISTINAYQNYKTNKKLST